MPRNETTPQLKLHKGTGQGYVLIDGIRHYLGRFDHPETQVKADRFVAEYLANNRQLPVAPDEITIVELVARYWAHVRAYYRHPDGTQTTEVENHKLPLRAIKDLYGSTRAAKFGPRRLKAVRTAMVRGRVRGMRKPGARKVINKNISRIKSMFRWATQEELVDPAVYQGLMAVKGLKRGRSETRETAPVQPVPEDDIAAVLPHVSRQIAADVTP